MVDRYTKIVLTVIAVALSTIAVQQTIATATAASDCGSISDPCYVDTRTSLDVYVENWP